MNVLKSGVAMFFKTFAYNRRNKKSCTIKAARHLFSYLNHVGHKFDKVLTPKLWQQNKNKSKTFFFEGCVVLSITCVKPKSANIQTRTARNFYLFDLLKIENEENEKKSYLLYVILNTKNLQLSQKYFV